MPRPKSIGDNPNFSNLAFIGNFKSYSSDLLFDFERIYTIQLERFEAFIDENYIDKFKEEIISLHRARTGLKLMNTSRIYLVTELRFVPLVLYNLEDCIVNNLENLFIADARSYNEQEYLRQNEIITLFAFKGSELAFQYDIPIFTAMKMLIGFSKENLINAGAFRDEWVNNPRKHERMEVRRWDNINF